MSLDGIWALEIANVYGWNRIGTVFLEKGRYLGASANFFSQGHYSSKGKQVKIQHHVTRHGASDLTVFGEKSKYFSIEFEGKYKKDIILGQSKLKDAHSRVATQSVRFIKLEKIKKHKKKS